MFWLTVQWEKTFTEKPEVFTAEEKRAWLDQMTDVTLGSDAFFPFSDNIERAHKSGVKYIAQPGGSVRDADVIATCDRYGHGYGIYRNPSVPPLIDFKESRAINIVIRQQDFLAYSRKFCCYFMSQEITP